uniref:Uncharacterized protein n=1 Tax=Anguilla anguilla TaxID=7936 RepID=A0A0E9VMD0_ANGAN
MSTSLCHGFGWLEHSALFFSTPASLIRVRHLIWVNCL